MCGQHGNVFFALTERCDLDGEDVEAIVEVFAETFGFDLLL